MRGSGPLAVLAVLASLGGCAGAAGDGARPPGGVDDRRARSSIEQGEDEILRDLAAIDRRLARRARVTPSEDDLRRVAMSAVLREDPTVAVVDGSIDPFSFDARARGLDAARRRIASLPDDGSRPSERELLTRLVDAELVRLEEERALPRSASALVRAIVDTWEQPKSAREAADDDRWLARRLGELRTALTSRESAATFDVVRARELDDALDALEHLASQPGFTATTREIVSLRDALEVAGSRPPAKAQSDWTAIARRAQAHLGIARTAEELANELATAEADLRARAEQAMTATGIGRDAIGADLERHVLTTGSCLDAVPGSRVRSMAAPQEREPACHLRHLVAAGEDERGRAVALAAMHDHVVVGAWAVDVARGAAPIAAAERKYRLLIPVLPDTRARYERIALARPIAAIGAGEAARIIGAGDARARARAWVALGDAPLDIVAAELGSIGR